MPFLCKVEFCSIVRWGRAHLLAVANNAAVNMAVQTSVEFLLLVLWGRYSEGELLDHMVILCLTV